MVPKGWRVYVYTREINYDPILYPEPLKFNPWRWMVRFRYINQIFLIMISVFYMIVWWMQDNEKLESHKYFLLFGGGSRMCPVKELGIVKVSMFLYYFVTKYRSIFRNQNFIVLIFLILLRKNSCWFWLQMGRSWRREDLGISKSGGTKWISHQGYEALNKWVGIDKIVYISPKNLGLLGPGQYISIS